MWVCVVVRCDRGQKVISTLLYIITGRGHGTEPVQTLLSIVLLTHLSYAVYHYVISI